MNGLDAIEQALQLSIWRHSYWEFMQAAWPYLSPKVLQPNWHHRLLCEKMQRVAEGKTRRLIINCGTGTLKSTILVEAFIPWVWIRKKAPLSGPQVQFLCSSHSEKLMNQHALVCRGVIESDWYQDWFGHLFKLTQKSIEHLRTDKLGHRRCTLATSATGLDADIALLDDPHELIDGQDSDIKREKVITAFDGSLERRVRDPNANAIVIGCARTHPKDLPGELMDDPDRLKREGWETAVYPDEYNPEHPFASPDDPRTEIGDPLHPDRESRKQILVRKARETDFTYSAQSGQWPTARAGSVFGDEARWPIVDGYPRNIDILVRSWDLAKTDPAKRPKTKRGIIHYTVGLLYGYDMRNRQRYIIDVIREQKSEEQIQDLIMLVAASDNQDQDCHVLIEQEKGAAGGHVIVNYQRFVLDGYTVIGWPATNPVVEATPVVQEARRGGIWLVEGHWNAAFKREAMDFPMGTWDDQICALSHANVYVASIVRDKKLQRAKPHPAVLAAKRSETLQ